MGGPAVSKRQHPASQDVFAPEVASAAVEGGLPRDHAMNAAIAAAMLVLADAPPGEIALISACRGAPLCAARDAASCPMCECIAVSEDGIVGYPGSGRA